MSESKNIENKIAAAAAKINAINYDKKNTHDNYEYASADAIFQATRDAIAEAGLTIWIHEEELKIELAENVRAGVRFSHFMIGVFRVGFTKEDVPPDFNTLERMTFIHPYLNTQSRGALTTYVEKMFLRAKFQLPTGDLAEEVDDGAHDVTDQPGRQPRSGSAGGGRPQPSSDQQTIPQEGPSTSQASKPWKYNKNTQAFDKATEDASAADLMKLLMADFTLKQRTPEQVDTLKTVVVVNRDLFVKTLDAEQLKHLQHRLEQCGCDFTEMGGPLVNRPDGT